MYKLLAIGACVILLVGIVSTKPHGSKPQDIGQMPTVVVTAARYDVASGLGLMDTVVVTAERYERVDVAWSGLLDTVTATKAPAQPLRGSTMPIMTYRDPLGGMMEGLYRRVE